MAASRRERLAFGTFLGLPDPMSFAGDADYIYTRYRADPPAAVVAEIDDKIAGSNFALHWGSVGVFGSLTVRPRVLGQGRGKAPAQKDDDHFLKVAGATHRLFTFAQSSKHVHLYQKFGFWPRFLTAIMSKPVDKVQHETKMVRYSQLTGTEREQAIEACKALTGKIYDGLDMKKEILSVGRQALGDIVLIYDGSLAGLAICHCGPGTEAGSGNCYVKFGAAAAGLGSEERFERLLDACESFASSQGLSRLVAGVNTGRRGAYERMIARKFSTDIKGVAMHKPNEAGYDREDVYLIDDWR